MGRLIFALLSCVFIIGFSWGGSQTPKHVQAAIEFKNQATQVLNNGKAFSSVSREDFEKAISFFKQALEEASKADISEMNKTFASFGDHFESEFIAGLKDIIDGAKTGDSKKFLNGQILISKFGEWFSANYAEIRKK